MRIRLENSEGVFQGWGNIPEHLEPPPAVNWDGRIFAADQVEGVVPVYVELECIAIRDVDTMES